MNQSRQLRMSKLALGLVVALAAAPSFAQSTSAGVGGVVTGSGGTPVPGAEVVITHVDSGTVARATTDESGRYNARGLRVGGPYRITITKPGEGTVTEDGVYLNLDSVNMIDASLAGDVATLDTVEAVYAGGSDVFSSSSMGAGTNVSREELDAFFSLNRDLQDYARLDPRISQTDKERGEISAGGQNTRYNTITIDRVATNDTFGLESNNLPTNRQPISIDAIQEVQVNITNYDVTQRGYTGANINAVTKSGTNNFFGSAYYIYRDADMVGDGANDRPFLGFNEDTTYGATLGGPILKDRLFFFANYEKSELTAAGGDAGPVGSGASNIVGNITLADVTEIQNIAAGYGLEAGGLAGGDGTNTTSESALVKIDWNITDTQRASFRVNRTEQDEAILPGFGNNFFSLSSYWYNQQKEFTNYVGEIFSDWSDSFSTEASVSYRDYASVPVLFARQPQVQVDFGNQNLRFGTEQFRHANQLETETLSAFFAGNYYLGDHVIRGGVDLERNDVFNLFVESNLGTYRFGSLANFRNGVIRDYALRLPTSGNLNEAAAQAEFTNVGFFLQDSWAVNANLTLQFGVRYDTLNVDNEPAFNPAASAAFGYRNDVTPDGQSLLQPRAGFNYTFDTDRPTQLRGGVGLFQGAAANVWLVNPYTNDGQSITVYGCGSGFTNSCAGVPFTPNDNPLVGSAVADVDFLDPNLEQPSVWKANIAFERELPWWGTVASAELVLTEVESGIYYQHLNLGAPNFLGPDGRLLYWSQNVDGTVGNDSRANQNPNYREVMLATQTTKGRGQNVTLGLEKPMLENWAWSLAYSYTEATDVSPLTSSRSISNWRARSIFNPNENVAARSNYAVNDRFVGTLRFQKAFFGDYNTEVSMFYEGRSGKPYSWTVGNDLNGDGQRGNDLMYIPAGPGDVIIEGGAADEAAFWDFIANNPDLAAARGRAIDRNSSASPWVNTFDMRFRQEFPGFVAEHKSELVLDIFNIGNLINKEWGQVEEIFFQSDGGPARSFVNYEGVDPTTGQYIYSLIKDRDGNFNPEGFGLRDRRGESRWAAQVTLRYRF